MDTDDRRVRISAWRVYETTMLAWSTRAKVRDYVEKQVSRVRRQTLLLTDKDEILSDEAALAKHFQLALMYEPMAWVEGGSIVVDGAVNEGGN